MRVFLVFLICVVLVAFVGALVDVLICIKRGGE